MQSVLKQITSDLPIELSLFAHIQNDAHISGSPLEGNAFESTASYLSKYIDSLKPEEVSDKIRALQDTMHQLIQTEILFKSINTKSILYDVAKKFAKQLIDKSIHTLALPGGWFGTPGHQMLYIFKITDQGFDFYIYNDGGGIEYHPHHSDKKRIVFSPVLIYQVPNPIDQEKLIIFIAELLRAQLPKLHKREDSAWDQKHLYMEIFPILYLVNEKTKIKSIQEESAPLISGSQLSGTCTQAVLHQLLKETFLDQTTYKKFIYQFKRYALDDFMKRLSTNHCKSRAVKNQIKHALQTIGRILLTEGLFDEAFISRERKQLLQYWNIISLISDDQQTDNTILRRDNNKHSKMFSYEIISHAPLANNFSTLTYDKKLLPSPSKITDGANLLTNLQELHETCKLLAQNNQYVDVIEAVEDLLNSLPLPNPEDPFHITIDFYQEITQENQGYFYEVINKLRCLYEEMVNKISGGYANKYSRCIVTNCSVMCVLDYMQNRLSTWNSRNAVFFGGTLHDVVVVTAYNLLQPQRKNPRLATNNPKLDRRLHKIKSIYVQQNKSVDAKDLAIVTAMLTIASLPLLGASALMAMYLFDILPDLSFMGAGKFENQSILYYMAIINSEPEMKLALEEYYANTLYSSVIKEDEGKLIDNFLKQNDCVAFYTFSRCPIIRNFPKYNELNTKLQHQKDLEHGLFKFIRNFRYEITTIDIIKNRRGLKYTHRINTCAYYIAIIEKPKTIIASDKIQYAQIKYVTNNPLIDETLENDFFIEEALRDNCIQLQNINAQSLIASRQYKHLRQSTSLQIRLSLHYFQQNLSKLSDINNQIYLEANLMQPILLLNELDAEKKRTDQAWVEEDKIEYLFDDFIKSGLDYHNKSKQCTQASIFFIRLDYLVSDYIAQETGDITRSEKLHNCIKNLLHINRHNNSAIKHSLYLYQFLTAMTLLRLSKRTDLIESTLIAFFQMNATQNPEIQLDKSSRLDLECKKLIFGRHIKQFDQKLLYDIEDKIINILLGQGINRSRYNVDLIQGRIFNDLGFIVASTPLNIEEKIKKMYPEADVSQTCLMSRDNAYFEMEYLKINVFHSRLQSRFNIAGADQWYTLIGKDDFTEYLPSGLYQKGTYFWYNPALQTVIITYKKHPIYLYNKKTKAIEQIDHNGNPNHYLLHKINTTWIEELFKQFEMSKYVVVCENNDQYSVEFSRYGFTLNVTNNSSCGLFASSFVRRNFEFRLEHNPSYRLCIDQDTGWCLKLTGLSNVPMMIFIDESTDKRFCYIPIQSFIINNKTSTRELSKDSEFYFLQLDIHNKINQLILEEEKVDYKEKLSYITNTELFVSIPLNSEGLLTPETTRDALYLAYVYLGNHQPNLAWEMMNYIRTNLGGLKASVAEIDILKRIVHEIPFDSLKSRYVPNTPNYVACKLKALAMLVSVLMPKTKVVFTKKVWDCEINDTIEHYKLDQTEKFYSNLSHEISELYMRYQNMYRDLDYNLQLSDEEKLQLLDYYHNNLHNNIGTLHYEYTILMRNLLIKEKIALEQLCNITENVPMIFIQRLQEINETLEREQIIIGHDFDITQVTVELDIPQDCKKSFETMTYDLTMPNQPNIEHLNTLSLLDLGRYIKEDTALFLRLFISDLSPSLNKKIIDFCKLYLLQTRYLSLKQKSENKLWYFCNIFYRIANFKSLFKISISSVLVKQWMFYTSEFITSKIFNSEIKLNDLLIYAEQLPNPDLKVDSLIDKSLNLQIENQEGSITSIIPIILNEQDISLRTNQFSFETMIKEKGDSLLELVTQYIEQAKIFGAPPNDIINDFKTEIEAGSIQLSALEKMRELALQIFNFPEIQTILRSKSRKFIEDIETILNNQLTAAIITANSDTHLSEDEKLRKELSIYSGLQEPLNKDKLLALYCNADATEYALETKLPDDSIKKLHKLLNNYVKLSVHKQSLQRFLTKIESLNEPYSTNDIQIAMHELIDQDLVDYKTETSLAFFQYHENILLRPQQKIALSRMLQQPDALGYANVIEKIIMGGGKSKVLLPLLAKHKANGTNLVCIEVPRSLFETNCSDLSSTSGKLFKQRIFRFEFDRTTNCSVDNLNYLHSRLIETIVRKNYVLTVGETIRSLQMKYIELLASSSEDLVEQQQIACLEKIVCIFRQRTDALIDEGHIGLLLKKKLNYTMGDSKPISTWIIKKSIALYDFLEEINITLDNGKSFILAEVLNNNQLLITPEDWCKAQEQLAFNLLKHANSPLKCAITHITDSEYDDLINYLLNLITTIPTCVQNTTVENRNLFALYKEQVSHLLPLTLKKILNVNYGSSHLNPDMWVAIPYIANNEPSESSRFGNYLEAMNLTIQMLLQEGMSQELLKLSLSQFQEKAIDELINNPGLQNIDLTKTGKIFHEWVGLYQLSEINIKDELQYLTIFENLSQNKKLICNALETIVLPHQKIDTKILSSNAHAHVNMYRSCQTVTGTTDFNQTWSSTLQFDKQNFPATNGFIIQILIKKETKISVTNYNQKYGLYRRVLFLLNEKSDVNAIIDVCAAFKGEQNEMIAFVIAKYLREKGSDKLYVIFFNKENMLAALSIKDENKKPILLNTTDADVINNTLGCGPEHRFTYYDQSHTTGTDLKQHPFAKALTLIDHKTYLQDFLQGAMRMRGLSENQTIEIIIPKELGSQTLENLLVMMENNQQQQLMQDIFQATKADMTDLVRSHIMDRILNSHNIKEKQQLLQRYEPLFISTIADDAEFFKQYGQIYKIYDTKILLEEHRDRLLGINCELMTLKSSLDSKIDTALPLCAKQYPSLSIDEDGLAVEVQNQVELQMEQEQEQELQLIDRSLIEKPYFTWMLSSKKQLFIPINGFYSLTKILQNENRDAPVFGEIYITSNYFQVYKSQDKYVNGYLKPVHSILFRKTSTIQCVILSQKEAESLAQQMLNNPEVDVWIANTAMTTLAGSPPQNIKKDLQYQELIEQIRFFNGEFKLLMNGDTSLRWFAQNTDQKIEYFQKSLRSCRESDASDLLTLKKALQVQSILLNFIITKPGIDYTKKSWKTELCVQVYGEEFNKSYINLLKAQTIITITTIMSEQSKEIFTTFLKHNHFQTNDVQLKSILCEVDPKLAKLIVERMFEIGDLSPDVIKILNEHNNNYQFYINCLASIALIAGGGLFVIGILAINPVAIILGSAAIAAGSSILLSQSSFFSKEENKMEPQAIQLSAP